MRLGIRHRTFDIGHTGWYWSVAYCPGPVIAILWLGFFRVVWNVHPNPVDGRGLRFEWNNDD